jgi:hypothetical protein
MVVTLAKNGEVLSTSELLKSKGNCYKNIRASMDEHDSIKTYFQDDTLKIPKVKRIFSTDKGIDLTDFLPHPIYTPSKKK